MELTPQSEASQLVRALRRAAGCSQRDLAAAAGLSKSLIAAIENGSRAGQWHVMLALAEAAGARLTIGMRDGTDLPWAEPAPGARDRGDRQFPAHAQLREAETSLCDTCNQFRDAVYGRPRTHTFRHPKPHSRWRHWRDWRNPGRRAPIGNG